LKVNEDSTKYELKLKDNIFFHDGSKMSIDDIIYTLEKIKDPRVNSPFNGYLFNVKIEKKGPEIVELTLPKKNYYFRDVLSLIYIVPKHI
jgi:peptide/nickel transport system substrate-binding protein